MTNLIFYNCLDCGTVFLGEHGVEPVCPGPECVLRRQEKIIRDVKKKIDILAGLLQYYTESRLMANSVVYVCPNCRTSFFSMNRNKLICPICTDCYLE